MCGRFTLRTDIEHLQLAFPIDHVDTEVRPRYNVAPSTPVATIIQRGGKNVLDLMEWGFLPGWAKEKGMKPMINVRAEGIAVKSMFKRAFQVSRCLILGDGFFEWQREGKQKIPLFIHLQSDKPFGLAGIYTVSKAVDGSPIATCAIITTTPNELLKPIHNRMPVILPRDAYEVWLDPKDQEVEKLAALLRPYPAGEMEAWEVSKLVNKPHNDSPEVIQRVAR
jgi:putative SOS response-associated peptidase YedK